MSRFPRRSRIRPFTGRRPVAPVAPVAARTIRRRWLAIAAAALATALLLLLFEAVIPSHFLAVAPGPSPDAASLVVPATGSGGGQAGDLPPPSPASRGRFLLTTVLASAATPLEFGRALVDPEVRLVPRAVFVPPGMSDEAYTGWGAAAMAESQATAAWQAWLSLGRETELVSDGVRVFFVAPAGPAAGQLQTGDVLTTWSLGNRSGKVLTAPAFEAEVRAAYAAEAGPGGTATLKLVFTRGGTVRTATLDLHGSDLGRWPFLGLALGAERPRTEPPVPVSFLAGDIGGPSGGLMLALQILDDFSPEDLTGGRTVAGSGTIGAGGAVGPVGGVALKLRGAREAGASVFLVPDQDYEEASRVIRSGEVDGLEVIPVSTLEEARQALVSLTGRKTAAYNRSDLPPQELQQAVWTAFGR